MSIGLGILLSTILTLVAWQIDKRGAWRKAGKGFAGLLMVLVVLGVSIAGYAYWEDASADRARRALADKLLRGELKSYWGIEFGMSPEDVLYLKGGPSKRMDKDGASPAQWHYHDANTPRRHTYTVLWDESNKVDAIVCSSEDRYLEDCEKIAGIGVADLESEVIATLGEPTTPPFLDEKGYKIMDYGQSNALRLILKKQRVEVLIFDKSIRKPAE